MRISFNLMIQNFTESKKEANELKKSTAEQKKIHKNQHVTVQIIYQQNECKTMDTDSSSAVRKEHYSQSHFIIHE